MIKRFYPITSIIFTFNYNLGNDNSRDMLVKTKKKQGSETLSSEDNPAITEMQAVSDDFNLEFVAPHDIVFEWAPRETYIELESDNEKGNEIYLKYNITRLDADESMCKGTLQPHFVEDSGKYVYNTTELLGEGIYNLSIQGYNKTTDEPLSICKNITFKVFEGWDIIDGIEVGISTGGLLTAAAVSAFLVSGSRYAYGIVLAGIGVFSSILSTIADADSNSHWSWLAGLGFAFMLHGIAMFISNTFTGELKIVDQIVWNDLWAFAELVNILNFGFLDFLSLIVDFALITAPGIIEDIFSTFLLLPEAVIMETLALKAVYYTASGYEDWRRWGYLIATTFAILGVFLGGTVFFHYFLEDYE